MRPDELLARRATFTVAAGASRATLARSAAATIAVWLGCEHWVGGLGCRRCRCASGRGGGHAMILLFRHFRRAEAFRLAASTVLLLLLLLLVLVVVWVLLWWNPSCNCPMRAATLAFARDTCQSALASTTTAAAITRSEPRRRYDASRSAKGRLKTVAPVAWRFCARHFGHHRA